MSLFDRFFKEEEPEKLDTGPANMVMEAIATPYFKAFVVWIDEELNRPLPLTADASAIAAASRANTLREVRSKIRRDIRRAEGVLAEAREEWT